MAASTLFDPPLGIRRVAKMLGVHPQSLRRAEREGRIPRAPREPVSRHRYYSPEAVEALRERLSLDRAAR